MLPPKKQQGSQFCLRRLGAKDILVGPPLRWASLCQNPAEAERGCDKLAKEAVERSACHCSSPHPPGNSAGIPLFIVPAHLARRHGMAWCRPSGVLQRLGPPPPSPPPQRVQLPGLPQVSLSLGPSFHSLGVGWGAPWPAPRPLCTVAHSSPMCLADSLTNPFPLIIPSGGPQSSPAAGPVRIQPEGENLEKAPRGPAGRPKRSPVSGPPSSWAPSAACTGGSGGVRSARIWSGAATRTRSREAGPAQRPDQPRTVCATEAPTPGVLELPAQWVRTRTALNSFSPPL